MPRGKNKNKGLQKQVTKNKEATSKTTKTVVKEATEKNKKGAKGLLSRHPNGDASQNHSEETGVTKGGIGGSAVVEAIQESVGRKGTSSKDKTIQGAPQPTQLIPRNFGPDGHPQLRASAAEEVERWYETRALGEQGTVFERGNSEVTVRGVEDFTPFAVIYPSFQRPELQKPASITIPSPKKAKPTTRATDKAVAKRKQSKRQTHKDPDDSYVDEEEDDSEEEEYRQGSVSEEVLSGNVDDNFDDENAICNCPCGATSAADGKHWVCCDGCRVWEHSECIGKTVEEAESGDHICQTCQNGSATSPTSYIELSYDTGNDSEKEKMAMCLIEMKSSLHLKIQKKPGSLLVYYPSGEAGRKAIMDFHQFWVDKVKLDVLQLVIDGKSSRLPKTPSKRRAEEDGGRPSKIARVAEGGMEDGAEESARMIDKPAKKPSRISKKSSVPVPADDEADDADNNANKPARKSARISSITSNKRSAPSRGRSIRTYRDL